MSRTAPLALHRPARRPRRPCDGHGRGRVGAGGHARLPSPGERGQPGSSSQKGVQGKSLPGTKSSAPADIPDGSNDDVIARQLREAAEKETDPELKEKLWDEYRRYKSGEL